MYVIDHLFVYNASDVLLTFLFLINVCLLFSSTLCVNLLQILCKFHKYSTVLSLSEVLIVLLCLKKTHQL